MKEKWGKQRGNMQKSKRRDSRNERREREAELSNE